jgi:Flp pilus assembly protein TadG
VVGEVLPNEIIEISEAMTVENMPFLRGINRKASRFFERFRSKEDGNVALIFAFSMIPISILALGAVDLHRASTIKMQLQDALDAATLAAARSTASTQAAIQTVGDKAFKANLKTFPQATLVSDVFTLQTDGKVTATAQVSVKPLVANMFLGDAMKVGATTEVVRANNKLEIALVLDNTGSMAGSKLTNTKTAANGLIDTLSAAAARSVDPEAVKISLVPFSMTVRVGATYKTSTWMDQAGTSPINNGIFTTGGTTTPSGYQFGNRWTLLSNMGLTWAGCVESRQTPYDVQDTAPSTGTPATLFTPYFYPDEPDKADYSSTDTAWKNYTYVNSYLDDGLTATAANKNWWKRQGSVTKYTSSGLDTSSGKGPNMGCTMQSVIRLTTTYSTLKTAVSAMVATGNTNVPMGLMWGWHTLSPNTPFADGKAYGTDKLKKIVILMTDGANTNDEEDNPNDSTYLGVGYIHQNRLGVTIGSTGAQRTTAMDNRFKTLCANMKASGTDIEIYSIGVEVDSTTSALLKTCASDADHFFDVTDSDDLADVFNTIAGSIANLHLSK